MSSSTAPAPLFTLQLQAGQRAWQRLPRGAEMVVTEGAVRLHRRAYLAGMWVDVPLLLRAGERHRVAGGAAWLEIEAVGRARVLVQQPAARRFPWSVAQRLSLIF